MKSNRKRKRQEESGPIEPNNPNQASNPYNALNTTISTTTPTSTPTSTLPWYQHRESALRAGRVFRHQSCLRIGFRSVVRVDRVIRVGWGAGSIGFVMVIKDIKGY